MSVYVERDLKGKPGLQLDVHQAKIPIHEIEIQEQVLPARNTSVNSITFLGHAGYSFEVDSSRILADPWFSRGKAFLGTWFQWPPNHHVPGRFPEVQRPDVIWVSHDHGDHFDPEFLNCLSKETPFIIGEFSDKRFVQGIRSLGFRRIKELKHLERHEVSPQVCLTVFIEQPEYTAHASLLIESKEWSIFHNADTSLSEEDLKMLRNRIGRPLDLFIGQYTDPSPFPEVIEWPEEIKAPYRKQNADWMRERMSRSCRILEARFAIPCAGPAVVRSPVGASTDGFQDGGPFDESTLIERLAANVPQTKFIRLQPGTRFEWNPQEPKVPDFSPLSSGQVRAQMSAYLQQCAEEKKITLPFAPALKISEIQKKAFQRARALCPTLFSELDILFRVRLVDQGITLIHDLGDDSDPIASLDTRQVEAEADHREYYELQLSSGIWEGFLKGELSFDTLNFGRMFKVRQSVAGFRSRLIRLLKSMPERSLLTAVNRLHLEIHRETIEVPFQGRAYRVLKRCPHLGASLEGCTPDDEGIIRCSGHGWKFDIRTGECILGDSKKSIAPAGV